MLLIQAKEKTIAEKHNFDEEDNPLVGTPLTEMTGNSKIEALRTNGCISNEDYENSNIRALNQTDLDNEGLGDIRLNGDFYIVNYETDDVIYSDGFKNTDGQVYYKLSDTLNL